MYSESITIIPINTYYPVRIMCSGNTKEEQIELWEQPQK